MKIDTGTKTFNSELSWISKYVCVLSCFSHVWLFATLWAKSPPDSSVHQIFQARMLKWVAISFSRGFSWPRDQTHVSYISCVVGGFFTSNATWEEVYTLQNINEGSSLFSIIKELIESEFGTRIGARISREGEALERFEVDSIQGQNWKWYPKVNEISTWQKGKIIHKSTR